MYVTQEALEKQAVAQVAYDEGDLMDSAPLERNNSERGVPVDAAREDPAAAAAALSDAGVVRLDGALGTETCQTLLAHVNAKLDEALEAVRAGSDPESRHFGNVLVRANRYDLKLPLEPPVRAALSEALGALGPTLGAFLGSDAELYELAALVSDPGAPRQPVHPDTGFSPSPVLASTFIALQDIDETMGPTVWLPRTQTSAAHAQFNGEPGQRAALLRRSPRRLGLLSRGDLAIFDSRLLHAGSANSSGRRRVVFYFSFKAKDARRVPPGSIRDELRGAQSLEALLASSN